MRSRPIMAARKTSRFAPSKSGCLHTCLKSARSGVKSDGACQWHYSISLHFAVAPLSWGAALLALHGRHSSESWTWQEKFAGNWIDSFPRRSSQAAKLGFYQEFMFENSLTRITTPSKESGRSVWAHWRKSWRKYFNSRRRLGKNVSLWCLIGA